MLKKEKKLSKCENLSEPFQKMNGKGNKNIKDFLNMK